MKTSIGVLLIVALALCGCAGPRPGGEAGAGASLLSIVEAEGAFSRAVAQKGTRDAFLEFLADDGIIFRPGPVNGREWLLEQPATPGVLSWRPTYAEVARSDDLGYTTGPWEFRQESGGKEVVTYGHYVSIWRRDVGGQWRLLLDLGVVHDPPRSLPSEVQFGPENAGLVQSPSGMDVEVEKEALLGMDRDFSDNSKSFGTVAAYMSFSADDIRFYRMNAFPEIGKKGVRRILREEPGLWTWEPIAAGISRAGDLGYTYGSAQFVKSTIVEDEIVMPDLEGAQFEHRSYVRVWRKNGIGSWTIALDMAIPLPPPAGEPEE